MPTDEKGPSVPHEGNRTDALPTPNDLPDGSKAEALPEISDHVLIRRIGRGAYGEVWLGRNAIGGLRAIKVVKRSTFPDEGAYQREFKGLRRFEPISRNYAGFVQILQVGENAVAGYFYYVMELADDVETGQRIDPNTYVARTLAHELAKPGRLPLETSLPIGLALAAGLAHLHAHMFIHRDIKPSNIIFVRGLPKLADIGLITEAGPDVSACGTLNYMPPELPGQPTGDIFSLGKVLYGLFMGMPCERFPEPPAAAEEFTKNPALRQLNNLILKACHYDPAQRFQTAHELHEELVSVSETVRGRPAGTGAPPPAGGVAAGKTPRTPEGPPGPNGEERPKARWPRMAALLVLLLAITGAVLFAVNRRQGQSLVPARVPVVVVDTPADRGVYDEKNKGKGITNGEELKNVLGQLPVNVQSHAISIRWKEMRWRGEALVIADKPALVLIHRSSFFHPIAAEQGLDYPPFTNAATLSAWLVASNTWTIQYQMCDSTLVSFVSNIGAALPHTRFLVYSRGTDVNWTNENFRAQWQRDVEERFPWLKDRVHLMWIQKGKDGSPGSFRHPETAEDIRNWVKSNLPPPEAAK